MICEHPDRQVLAVCFICEKKEGTKMLLLCHLVFIAVVGYFFGVWAGVLVGVYLAVFMLYICRYNSFVYCVVRAQRDEIERLRSKKNVRADK